MKLIEFTSDENACSLLDIKCLKKELSGKNINVLLCNIRSMRKNFNHLTAFIQQSAVKFSIVILNETHLDADEQTAYNLTGYTMHSQCRNRFGGGLLILCDDSFRSETVPRLTGLYNTFESLFINIKTKTGKILIGTIYRPPSGSISSFCDEFEAEILLRLPKMGTVIMGGMNIDLLAEVNNSNLKFITAMNDRNFESYINRVTRDVTTVSGSSATILDHIWSNIPIGKSFVIEYAITDHFPVGCSLKVAPEGPAKKLVSYREFSAESCRNFKLDFIRFAQSLDLNVTDEPGIHQIFSQLVNYLEYLTNRYFPIQEKMRRASKLKNPWIDKDLAKLIDKKHKIYKLFRQGKTNFNTYKRYRNLLTKTINVAKKCYYIKIFKEVKTSSKDCWKQVNKIIKPHKAQADIKLKIDDKLVVNPNEVLNKLNVSFDFLPSLFDRSANYRHKIRRNEKSFVFFEVLPYEISKIIMNLKNNNKNTSKIPTVLIKHIVTELSQLLAYLFNLCFLLGVFPNELKYSEILPIPKKGSPLLIQNYRPISMLGPITKIFEKLIYERLNSFFNKHKLFTQYQFGFRKGRDISKAASNFLYYVNESNKNNETLIATYIDFSRAFDSINRKIFLDKLELYGVRGTPLNLIKSYFENRYQSTKLGKYKSEVIPSTRGTPQGSALGPLFFSIFINDIVEELTDCHILLYADDIVLFSSNKDVAALNINMNNNLTRTFNWTQNNELSINYSKTKSMIFTRKRNVSCQTYINNKLIENVSEFTYLGLLIDQNLTFKNHILNIVKKVNRANGCFYSMKFFLPTFIMRKLYLSMIHSHLNQHIISWGGANKSNLYPLRVAVNKAIRNTSLRKESTNIKYKNLGVLNLEQLYQLKLGEVMFETLITKNSPLLIDISDEIEWTHNYDTRRVNSFKLPKICTEANRRYFISNALKLWASIPGEIKSSNTILTFKSKLKKLLLESGNV